MSYIRVQSVERDESGRIIRGSAALCESVYRKGQGYHSQQRQIERLGKVIWLSDDGKSGIFLSKTRGLVEYSVDGNQFKEVPDDDPRIAGGKVSNTSSVHTVFGDAFLLLSFVNQCGMASVLRDVFDTESGFERFICHSAHSILKEGARISCDCFTQKSVISYLCDKVPVSSLRSDTAFFTMMGDDGMRVRFFKAFIDHMRRGHSGFGKCCYVDSTPLPNESGENPFNALCSHGVGHVEVQTRLVLILDEETNLPVWYTLIPGNLLDVSTIREVVDDVADTLDIEIDSMVLDAGYVTKHLVQTYCIGSNKSMTARMPAKKGYPFKQLYHEMKTKLSNGKYTFVRNGHTYFGDRKKIQLFDKHIYAYVYVDKLNAVTNGGKWIAEHWDEYEEMSMADRSWTEVRFGYFVLISNKDKSPEAILDDYFGRTHIESVIKTGKEYVNLLPLCKWNATTISGKILLDIIDLILYLMLRRKLEKANYSITALFGMAQSLMCHKDKNNNIKIETPNRQIKQFADDLGVIIPAYMKFSDFKKLVYGR